jgi:uncharacterized protein
MNLVVVASALPFRARAVPFDAALAYGRVITKCWRDACWAHCSVLLFGHEAAHHGPLPVSRVVQTVLGLVAGVIIGTVALYDECCGRGNS